MRTGWSSVAKRKKETPCDRGEHKMFDTLGGDSLCALGCGFRKVGGAEDLKQDGLDRRNLESAAESHDDAELLAWLEDE